MDTKFTSLYFKMMRFKNTVLLFCCFAITTQICQAQPYESIFGTNTASWNVFGANSLSTWTDSVYFKKDSVITGTTYKVVQAKGSFPDTVYFVREDTITGKLYYGKKGDTSEILVMDLSLNPGDSFFIETHDGSSMPETWHVDSVFTDTGRKHIELVHGSTPEKITFIEGIGPSAGILYPESPSFIIPELICAWKNGNQTFANPDFNNRCNAGSWSTAEDLQSHKENSITLYPNPASQYLKVESQEQNIYNITIFNMSGREMINRKLSPDRATYSVQLNIEKFPSGIYFLSVETQEETVIEKIIKL